MKLSYLEDLLERYDIHLSPKVNAGLDDSNIGRLYTTNFVDEMTSAKEFLSQMSASSW